MKLQKEVISQDVIIKRQLPGYYDDDQQRVEPGLVTIATVKNALIFPANGKKVSIPSKVGYYASHECYLGTDDITWEPGYTEILAGDIVSGNKDYEVIVPGLYLNSHYQSAVDQIGV